MYIYRNKSIKKMINEIKSMPIYGKVTKVVPINAYNGDYLVYLVSEYQTAQKELLNKGIYIEKRFTKAIVRNYKFASALISHFISAELILNSRESYQAFMEIKIKTVKQ